MNVVLLVRDLIVSRVEAMDCSVLRSRRDDEAGCLVNGEVVHLRLLIWLGVREPEMRRLKVLPCRRLVRSTRV